MRNVWSTFVEFMRTSPIGEFFFTPTCACDKCRAAEESSC